jgi:hypothetical protein
LKNDIVGGAKTKKGVKMIIKVGVHGCDDSTIFNIEATPAEFEFLKRVAEKCTSTSENGCQPKMEVEEAPQNTVEAGEQQATAKGTQLSEDAGE